MEGKSVLIVEDNEELSMMTKSYLQRDGYFVYQAFDGRTAVELAREKCPDIVLLDLMLPELDGVEVCRIIRKDMNIPIIVTSAKTSEDDKLRLLGIGADDYMTKPFSLRELLARVAAQLRRATELNAQTGKYRHCGRLTIGTESATVLVDGEALVLSAKEYGLLDFLTLHPGQVFTKQQLIDRVWGYEEIIDENTVTVTVARLREKLSKHGIDELVTVWGVGYKWQK